MIRFVSLAALLALSACALPAVAWSHADLHARRHHRHAVERRGQPRYAAPARRYRHGDAARPYASSVSPTITCRYPDGTPFDPDIIGGPNHVGDGGPAANLGGFDPCGF